jgi:hypothetical protein
MKRLLDHLGRAVRLTDERREHILLHREMVGLESGIEETLRQPERVVRSLSDERAELFYRLFANTVLGQKWLCVVVKYPPQGAFVLTAYLTDRIKAGEQLWPSK